MIAVCTYFTFPMCALHTHTHAHTHTSATTFFYSRQYVIIYVQVTVHRDKLRIKQPNRCLKYPKLYLSQNSTCFGHLLCPSSGVMYCTHDNCYVSCRFLMTASKQSQVGTEFQPDSARNCRKYSR
jgi:hypothetical protein